jgi:hypothetical protein
MLGKEKMDHLQWTISEARRYAKLAKLGVYYNNIDQARDCARFAASEAEVVIKLMGKTYAKAV